MLKSKTERKTNARNPVSYQLTQPMVMSVANDRVRTRPDYRPDAAENRDGVFALLEDHELSPAERARLKRGDEARAAKASGKPAPEPRPKRIWSPKEIFRKTIMLYKKLKPVKNTAVQITPTKTAQKEIKS